MAISPLLRVGVVAGEASGDALGGKLIEVLRAQYPHLHIEGIGGPLMQAAGCQTLFDIERLSVMGLIEPIKRLPDLIKLRRQLYHHFQTHPPHVFIGIDAPDFNLGLELKLRKSGIPTVHLVSPSVWAWRKRRIHKIKKAVDLMLTLFPFEEAFYQTHQVPVRYLGHPLAERIPLEIDTQAARHRLSLNEPGPYIALLPGSRRQELNYLSPVFLQAAQLIKNEYPNARFITSHLTKERISQFEKQMKLYAGDLPLTIFENRTHDVMAASDVVMVTSGTATLETMLYKKPMVIAYRMSALGYFFAAKLVKGPIGLPNIIAKRTIVTELIQYEATPEAISLAVCQYLQDPAGCERLRDTFTELHQSLLTNGWQGLPEQILGVSNYYR